MTPIVIELDDDDCDGKVTERDIPDIVFTTFSSSAYNSAGTVHAISIIDGKVVEKTSGGWPITGVIRASAELAAGNIDGVPGNEVVACGQDGFMYAFNADGTQLWKSAEAAACRLPSIADIDGDGTVEILATGVILDGKTGSRKGTVGGGLSVTADRDGDGTQEIVGNAPGGIAAGHVQHHLQRDRTERAAALAPFVGQLRLVAAGRLLVAWRLVQRLEGRHQ